MHDRPARRRRIRGGRRLHHRPNHCLEPGRRIVQTWRTSEFSDADPDSEIEVLLEPVDGGTRLTLHHRHVPDGQLDYEHGGWQDNYFEPMRGYFSER
jgi:activator of HSP90 ATPase